MDDVAFYILRHHLPKSFIAMRQIYPRISLFSSVYCQFFFFFSFTNILQREIRWIIKRRWARRRTRVFASNTFEAACERWDINSLFGHATKSSCHQQNSFVAERCRAYSYISARNSAATEAATFATPATLCYPSLLFFLLPAPLSHKIGFQSFPGSQEKNAQFYSKF